MRNLVQIVYVSRSTFTPMPPERGIESRGAHPGAVADQQHPGGLVGALYFGDGCFFQCLKAPRRRRTASVPRYCATRATPT